MNSEKFSNLEELYQKVLPALRTKKNEMIREKMLVTEEDIWNYFCTQVWPGQNALTLGIMVDNILNTDNFVIFRSKGGKNGSNYRQ